MKWFANGSQDEAPGETPHRSPAKGGATGAGVDATKGIVRKLQK